MHVVRHEAVREYFEPIFSRSAQELRPHQFDDVPLRERNDPLIRHERKQICVPSAVVKRGTVRRVRMYHLYRKAQVMPMSRVYVANGNLEAEQVRAFLEAHDVRVLLRGETIRSTHG